jgi:hypothetical protein
MGNFLSSPEILKAAGRNTDEEKQIMMNCFIVLRGLMTIIDGGASIHLLSGYSSVHESCTGKLGFRRTVLIGRVGSWLDTSLSAGCRVIWNQNTTFFTRARAGDSLGWKNRF